MSGATDPRRAGGNMTSIGGGKNETVFDTSRAVLLDYLNVAVVETTREGKKGPLALAMMLQGRINKTDERARILFLFDEDGCAALVSELVALGSRLGPEFRDRLLDRVSKLLAEGHMREGGAGR